MDLPVRIQLEPGDEPVLSVDGAFDAPGLNLSHWPGNRTPAALRHDLSTGIALRFAKLDAAERDALAGNATALVNNHFDTDGVLAMFAILHPDQALPRAESMLAAAAAGDLFRLPGEEAFIVDTIVGALADPQRSPLAADLGALEDRERWEVATLAAIERVPELMEGRFEGYEDLFREDLEALRADQVDLARASLDDLVHLDFASWTVPAGTTSTRPDAPAAFDPGRHALWGANLADRQLVIGSRPHGTTYRFLIGTRSFFDMVTERPQPRPRLRDLAQRLNELEGVTPADEQAWRHQRQEGASPELWFGADGLSKYAEHAGTHLAESSLQPQVVKAAILDALRATWVWPEETSEQGELAL